MKDTASHRAPVFLPPGEGRNYPMGRISALFKADGAETGNRYSISEWRLDAHKPMFSPHMDTGDYVIIVNADKVALTGEQAPQTQQGVTLPRRLVRLGQRNGAGGSCRATRVLHVVVSNQFRP
jgi:hypothetical protein